MTSAIREKDQVREMLMCLRDFLSANMRYSVVVRARQNSINVTLLFRSQVSIVSRVIYSLFVKVNSQARCLLICINALPLAWRTTSGLDVKPAS